ncbi:MAG: YggT family protein [Candidatus Omnitrophica bacterium]|nr:YggT family protein [Candidatus Omnitrophota bacterium]
MFILGNIVITLAKLTDVVLTIFFWLVMVRAVISWVNADPFNPIVQFLHRTTEPILEPIRRLLPPMGLDFSPIIVFLLIMVVKGIVVQSLYDLGIQLKY